MSIFRIFNCVWRNPIILTTYISLHKIVGWFHTRHKFKFLTWLIWIWISWTHVIYRSIYWYYKEFENSLGQSNWHIRKIYKASPFEHWRLHHHWPAWSYLQLEKLRNTQRIVRQTQADSVHRLQTAAEIMVRSAYDNRWYEHPSPALLHTHRRYLLSKEDNAPQHHDARAWPAHIVCNVVNGRKQFNPRLGCDDRPFKFDSITHFNWSKTEIPVLRWT